LKATGAKTRRIALISLFAVLSTVLDSIVAPGLSSGVWYGWVFVMSPITGILLGPKDGFIATLISVMVGHSLVFRETVYEYIFTIGAPVGSLISGLVFRGDRGKVLIYYTFMLSSYFITQVSRSLPLWGMWDVYFAYIVLWVVVVLDGVRMPGFEVKTRNLFALCAFLGLEADILFRIFVLVPCRAYEHFYSLTPEALALLWAVPAPLITPIKVALSVLVAATIGPPIMGILKESGLFPLDRLKEDSVD
jgi:hypothetical protein